VAFAISLDFKEVGCDANPPLIFKLGMRDAAVESTLVYSAARTLGFALRTSYDDTTTSAQGFVWLAPDKGDRRYQGSSKVDAFWSDPIRKTERPIRVFFVLGCPESNSAAGSDGLRQERRLPSAPHSPWDGVTAAPFGQIP
jgi:hypothetical protein